MGERREVVGRKMSQSQSSTGPPEMQMVSVAVLPPRLPRDVAPPSGTAAAGAFGWDESLNWQHNDRLDEGSENTEQKKSLRKRMGFTRERKKVNPDTPPFVLRQVPWAIWRKHYAKDADGNYRGTHAPAEDCLLKPEDVAKWRFDSITTKADQWTRGPEVLPVYAEVREAGHVPAYTDHSDDLMGQTEFTAGEPASQEGGLLAGRQATNSTSEEPVSRGRIIAEGKTAQEIIEEAKNKPQPSKSQSWRDRIKRAAEYTAMGS